uniref:Olfactory receptor n=1 Tax=Salvator merianae TaxID=96440 RepID=A0A8D0BJR4_SALMN
HCKGNGTDNQTTISEFILLGISSRQDWNIVLFIIFLTMYIITVLGNITIVLAIRLNSHLYHTPMYFLLSNLSLVDICFTTTTVPKILAGTLSGIRKISFSGCLSQMYFFTAFGITESFLLASMALDRYVAICRPLHYATLMSSRICFVLVAASWLVSHLHSLLHTLLMSRLSFCASNLVPHFFCDVFPLLKLSCSNTVLNTLLVYTEGNLMVNGALIFIALSYTFILMAVLRIPSVKGKQKALSTCGSHVTVVALLYGTVIWVYFQPSSNFSAENDTLMASVFYTVVIPTINPAIYSLRNSEVKQALKRRLIKQGYQNCCFRQNWKGKGSKIPKRELESS